MPHRGDSADFALSTTQVQKVLASCVDLTDRVIIGLQLFDGLRVSEVSHFNASWITQQGDLKVPQQQRCNCAECSRNRNQLWKPKTKAGARTLPIPKRMRRDLATLLKMQPHGLGISRIAIYYRTKAILKRAGVRFKGVAQGTGFPHCLRATAATMLAAHLTSSELCYIMGWRSIDIGESYIKLATLKPSAMEHMRGVFG